MLTTQAALTWLNDLMQWLGRWVPRLILVHPTHRGVLFGPGGSARNAGAGLVFYWPITHELVNIPVTTVSVQFYSQVLPIANVDNAIIPHVAVCAAAVQFRVVDAVAAATKALNLHALVDNRGQAALARHWPGAMMASRDWVKAAREELEGDLREFGVALARLDIVHVGIGVALKNLQDYSYSDSASGQRPSEAA